MTATLTSLPRWEYLGAWEYLGHQKSKHRLAPGFSNSTALELGWRKARKSPIVPGASPVAMDAASLEKGKNNGKTMVNQEGAISGFHGEIMAFMDWFEGF